MTGDTGDGTGAEDGGHMRAQDRLVAGPAARSLARVRFEPFALQRGDGDLARVGIDPRSTP